MDSAPTLQLVRERKISDQLPDVRPRERWEASGVLAKDGKYFIVFDNRTAVARLSDDLHTNKMNGLFGTAPRDQGYEGIGYNEYNHRFYLLVEARKHKNGKYYAQIVEYDNTLSYVKQRPIDFKFKSGNKGFEAIAHVRRDGQDFALALCEGNKCSSGSKGRTPGGGRIQLFEERKRRWSRIDAIKLPKSVRFTDYSAMAIHGGRVAVVSQESSMLWIGVFEESAWDWRDAGQLYLFPRTESGDIHYGNVEGVTWITHDRIGTVSDKRKKHQPEHCADKDESVHIFDIPRS